MNDPAYDEGRRAAAQDIPADANPYTENSPQHAQWISGHASFASTAEASQSEGT